ncbi:hypothetical protein ANCCEY_01585 [Ancylostoma ceylanicum]|uniref:PH domain-containing protein n=1 Tax=Ancylostoma ceylanicum TaxID=53326 RepID=A0A0D6MCP9_9BILA|nr:hypothetical protein ANCCEY_01585 [Ancylostoma ceylanicum]
MSSCEKMSAARVCPFTFGGHRQDRSNRNSMPHFPSAAPFRKHETNVVVAVFAVQMEGPLSKWTNMVHGWQYRWFRLEEDALLYYTSREKMLKGQQRGCMRLHGAVVGIDGENNSLFTVTVDGKVFHLQVELDLDDLYPLGLGIPRMAHPTNICLGPATAVDICPNMYPLEFLVVSLSQLSTVPVPFFHQDSPEPYASILFATTLLAALRFSWPVGLPRRMH